MKRLLVLFAVVLLTSSRAAEEEEDEECVRPDCSAVLCAAPDCEDDVIFTPPGQCCATCLRRGDCGKKKPSCDNVTCETQCCQYGSYKSPCDCCSRCI